MSDIELSLKDRKILKELNIDSRQSFSAIGKKIGLPKNVVTYRIKKLVDDGILTLFCTTFNRSKLEYNYWRLFLKFQHFSDKLEDELVEFLKKTKDVHWVARLEGNYDFCIIFLTKNIKQIDEIHNSIIYKFNKHIVDKEFNIATRLWYLPYNYIYDTSDNRIAEIKPEDEPATLDKKDYELINLIKENSRIPMLTLMREMQMSPQMIRKRIQSLLKRKIINGFNIRIDHTKFKLHHFHTFLYLQNIDPEKEKRLISALCSKKSITHILKSLGKWSLEFESIHPTHFELYALLKELKDAFPETIIKYEPSLIYKIYPINTVKYEIPATFK